MIGSYGRTIPHAVLAAITAVSLVGSPVHAAPLSPCESNWPDIVVSGPSCDHWYDAPTFDPNNPPPPGTILGGGHAPRPSSITGFGVSLAPLISSATQIMYASRDVNGNPVAAVATIIQPTAPSPLNPRPLLSYQTAEDGLSQVCAPSYRYQQGQDKDEVSLPLILEQGWPVVISDYEGLSSLYTVGPQAAHGVLDGIRAALNWAAANPSVALFGADSPIGLWGYSGGALASGWASHLAATYAPELTGKVVAVAEGGVPANIYDIARNLDGGLFSGIELAGSVGMARAYPELRSYFNAAGLALADHIGSGSSACIESYTGAYTFQSMSTYSTVPDVLDEPAVKAIIDANSLIAGDALGGGTPNMPIYIYHAINDELIPVKDVNALVAKYCSLGVKITYYQDPASEHVSLAFSGAQGALAYLNARFEGIDVPSTCALPTVPPNM